MISLKSYRIFVEYFFGLILFFLFADVFRGNFSWFNFLSRCLASAAPLTMCSSKFIILFYFTVYFSRII